MGFLKSTRFILCILGALGRFKCFHYISWLLPSNEKYFKICIHVTVNLKDYFICPSGTWILNSFGRGDTPMNQTYHWVDSVKPQCTNFFFQRILLVSGCGRALFVYRSFTNQLQPLLDTKIWKILISHISITFYCRFPLKNSGNTRLQKHYLLIWQRFTVTSKSHYNFVSYKITPAKLWNGLFHKRAILCTHPTRNSLLK